MLLHIEQKALDYLRKNGHVLTIDYERTEGEGEAAGKAFPKIVLGKPENMDLFKLITPHDLQVYLNEELILENYGKTVKIAFEQNLFSKKLKMLEI
ncbi:hypothetical protein [Dethiobacter alkaliphilus]|uniref:hypothetical protein n=1 Tax=Dethiobacter alkaliphilus TaxID=427926 RepID=UPI002226E9F4|nr:hypothetical protein [Dethiobacter alkaliphilus]MCW3490324.1 hypothetical protein [Dethiobacter alkaliphilus]